MRIPIRTTAMILLAALSACGDPVGPPNGASVHGTRDAVTVINTTADEALFTFMIDAEQSAVVDWEPCIEDECGRIEGGATLTVSADSLGVETGDVVFVYTWRMVVGPDDSTMPGPVVRHEVLLNPWFVR